MERQNRTFSQQKSSTKYFGKGYKYYFDLVVTYGPISLQPWFEVRGNQVELESLEAHKAGASPEDLIAINKRINLVKPVCEGYKRAFRLEERSCFLIFIINLRHRICAWLLILMSGAITNKVCADENTTSIFSLQFNVSAGIEDYNYNMLVFKLTNQSLDKLEFYPDVFLRHNIALALIEARTVGIQLKEWGVISDIPTGTIKLDIGDEYVYKMNLNRHFPDLVKSLQQSPVIVFWSVEPKPIGKSKEGRFGGCLIIDGDRDEEK